MDIILSLIHIVCMLCIMFSSNQVANPKPEESELTVQTVDVQQLIQEQEAQKGNSSTEDGGFVLPDYEALSKRSIENGETPPDLYIVPNPFNESTN